MSDEVQGKQSSREKHFSCSKAPVKRPLESITVPSSKFFTAKSAVRLALVSFRTRAKRGIARAGGDQIARRLRRTQVPDKDPVGLLGLNGSDRS